MGGRFIARGIDTDKVGLGGVLEAAHAYDGAAFVEIFQNCIVYNDAVFKDFTDKANAADAQIRVEHGKPLLFGEAGNKGLSFDARTMTLGVVDAATHEKDVLIHDETNPALAQQLLGMQGPRFPMALGVIFRQPAESFEDSFYANHPTKLTRTVKVADVLRQTNTWRVD